MYNGKTDQTEQRTEMRSACALVNKIKWRIVIIIKVASNNLTEGKRKRVKALFRVLVKSQIVQHMMS